MGFNSITGVIVLFWVSDNDYSAILQVSFYGVLKTYKVDFTKSLRTH